MKGQHVKFNTMVNSNKPKSIWNYQFCKHLKNQIALKKANQLLDDLKSKKGNFIINLTFLYISINKLKGNTAIAYFRTELSISILINLPKLKTADDSAHYLEF